MKTNAFRYLGLALMAVLTLSLTSCEVEIDSFYDDDNIGGGYYNRSSKGGKNEACQYVVSLKKLDCFGFQSVMVE
ncbi:hypothetical protein [Bacteroides thetaiotaomicron]|uniref:hypothetical protein n=1 Tax=Bacteroides thetaiotaomicron TaxID=818 RepID=UPI00216536FB|nr:hypothetical protein [Bacteroides thetaiotaomicron]MCS2603362.1 hypothetical protein [Bacteroides thetaiotaomicron]